jgi:RNase P subunit RPR2
MNPLSQYFRQPSIYIKLPSQGNYYPLGAIEMPQNGEIPVLPMTAIDEITYRTPDALFSGQAVINVIQSCVPAIKDAWAIPSIDIDTILVAIRIASYGHEMTFSTTCPKCQNEDEYAADLRNVLEQMKTPDYSNPIKQGDIEIYFRPMTYKNLSDNNKIQFDEQRIFQSLPNNDNAVDTAQLSAMSAALQRMTEMTVSALSQSILTIKTPSAMVTEQEYISEFMKNCDSALFNRIQNYVVEHKSQAEMQPITITCNQCQNEYKQSITLDMSNFFGRAS